MENPIPLESDTFAHEVLAFAIHGAFEHNCTTTDLCRTIADHLWDLGYREMPIGPLAALAHTPHPVNTARLDWLDDADAIAETCDTKGTAYRVGFANGLTRRAARTQR